MDKNNNNMVLIAIVAIVAIVGIVVAFAGNNKVTYSATVDTDETGNMGGMAIGKIASVDSIEKIEAERLYEPTLRTCANTCDINLKSDKSFTETQFNCLNTCWEDTTGEELPGIDAGCNYNPACWIFVAAMYPWQLLGVI